MANILMQMMSNFTSTITNSLQRQKSNQSSSANTPEILNQLLSVFWDLYEAVLSQCPSFDNMQQMWNEINEQRNLTDKFGDIFQQFIAAVKNIVKHLIRWFDSIIPAEKRDEKTRYLFNVASLMVLCMGFLASMYKGLGSIVCLYYTVRFLCLYIICIIKILLWSVKARVLGLPVIYRCVKQWLWFGAKVGMKMMNEAGSKGCV